MNSKEKRWLTGGAILVLTLLIIRELGELFPYTGLRAIVIYPFIVIINSGIIFGTILLSKKMKRVTYILTWTLTAIVTTSLTIGLHPQEFRPNAFKQISYTISAIKQFDKSPITDLDLPFSVDDFGRYDCEIRDSQEKYIVALYKYKHTIPLDGSFKVYREEKTGVVSYDTDNSIKRIEDIPLKLETGQDRLIWWTLEKLGR